MMTNGIEVRTDRLVVTEHQDDDLTAMHQLLSNPQAMYYLDNLRTKTLEETDNKLKDILQEQHNADRTKFFLKITDPNEQYLGEIGFTLEKAESGRMVADLGFFIMPDYWGMGIATEAVMALVDHAFANLGIERFEASCFEENRASENVMKKAGMTEDTGPVKPVFHNGVLKNRLKYFLNKGNWEKSREDFRQAISTGRH